MLRAMHGDLLSCMNITGLRIRLACIDISLDCDSTPRTENGTHPGLGKGVLTVVGLAEAATGPNQRAGSRQGRPSCGKPHDRSPMETGHAIRIHGRCARMPAATLILCPFLANFSANLVCHKRTRIYLNICSARPLPQFDVPRK